MNFPYQPAITVDPVSGDGLLIGRPEVLITVHGETDARTYQALVDTGADRSVFPSSMANDLGIKLMPAMGKGGLTFSGEALKLSVGIVVLELSQDDRILRWPAAVLFHDFANPGDESVILGHAGFLEYFTATFDGSDGVLSLVANEYLPQST